MPKRHDHAGRRLDAHDVLAGRVRPTAVELLDLIHRVNPTGRDLPAREADLRYAQKARLQSLLLRSFAAEITVVPDPAREGTVSLVHRGRGRDACHAVIAELDEDARAWVQLQVDLGPQPDEAPSPAVPAARPSGRGLAAPPAEDEDDTPAALVLRAERAIADFDYETARALLESALSASGGAPEPATALLALLVETLGDDTAALGLQRSLSRAALDDARVRALLSLAAARTGDEERALALMRGAGDAHAAAVLAALAGAALAGGDADRAAALLAQARLRDAAHPAIGSIAAEIAKQRAAERKSVEEMLGHLVETGPEDEAERRAHEVLARWPESEAAGRALRTLAERRKRSEVERLGAEAEAALARGDAVEALARMARMLAAAGRGPERDALSLRMAHIETAARAQREAAAVEAAQRRLQAADPREGLSAYLELDEPLRARVRAGSPREPALAVLDLVAGGRGSAHAKVDAVVALGKARTLAQGDPEGAAAILEAHLGLLERVPEARRLLDEVRSRAAARRAARAREAVQAARASLAAGEAAAAQARLVDAVLRDLPDEERIDAEALRARAAAAVSREERAAVLAKLRAAGRLFEARALCDELAESTEPAERARWEAERKAIQEAIQASFRVAVDRDPAPLTELWINLWKLDLEETVRALTADGQRLVLAEIHERWVLVREIVLQTQQVLVAVLLRTPEPLGVFRIELRGPRLWLVGVTALELSVETWEVLTWRGTADLVRPGEQAWDILLAAPQDPEAPRYLWTLTGPGPRPKKPRATMVRVLDVDRRRVAREVPDTGDLVPIVGADEPRVGCTKVGVLTVHEARGAPVPGGRIDRPSIPRAMARRPDGPGLLMLAGADDDDEAHRLIWYEISPEGIKGPPHHVDRTDGRTHAAIGVSREAGMVFVVARTPEGTYDLIALRPAGGTLEEAWRVGVATYTLLMQDAASRHIVAFHADAGSFDATLLGPEPPEPPEPPDPAAGPPAQCLWYPTPATAVACEYDATPSNHELGRRLEGLMRQSAELRAHSIEEDQKKHPDDPAYFFDRVLWYEHDSADSESDAARIRAWLEKTAPDHPSTRVLRAYALMRRARWSEMLEALDGLGDADVGGPPARKRHFHHVVALASLHTGDLERARANVAAAREHEGPCALDDLAHLLDALAEPAPPWDDADPVTRWPIMMRTADDLLAADEQEDLDTAMMVLGKSRNVDEVQSLARLAELWLRLDPDDEHERVQKVLSLARFIEINLRDPFDRPHIPLGRATWSAEQLADVDARARAWLENPD